MTNKQISLLRKMLVHNFHNEVINLLSKFGFDPYEIVDFIILLENFEINNKDIQSYLRLNEQQQINYTGLAPHLKNIYSDMTISKLLNYELYDIDQYKIIGKAIENKYSNTLINRLVDKDVPAIYLNEVFRFEENEVLTIYMSQLDILLDETYLPLFNSKEIGKILTIFDGTCDLNLTSKQVFKNEIENNENMLLKKNISRDNYYDAVTLLIIYDKLNDCSKQCIKDYFMRPGITDRKDQQKVLAFTKKVV